MSLETPQTDIEPAVSSADERVSRGKAFMQMCQTGDFSSTDYNKVKERLDALLINPINIIANIVNEKTEKDRKERLIFPGIVI